MIDSKGRTYIKIYCCGDCDQYSWPMHRCKLGAHVHGNVGDCFYLDCPYLKEEKEPRWIPVTERLPEIKGHYVSDACLVCLKDGGITFAELQENIFGQVGWDIERDDDYHLPRKVIAWMPLPKAYQEKKDASVD